MDIPVVIYSTSFSHEDVNYFLSAGAFIHQKQVKYKDIMQNLVKDLEERALTVLLEPLMTEFESAFDYRYEVN